MKRGNVEIIYTEETFFNYEEDDFITLLVDNTTLEVGATGEDRE
jgi:hypothetical protein